MWKRIANVLRMLTAGSLVLAIGLFLLIMDTRGAETDWRNSQDVFVRNQTRDSLLLTLTLPRSALETDTVWWGIADTTGGLGRKVGYALRLHMLTADGLRQPPFQVPVLLAGTVNALVPSDVRPGLRFGNQGPWLTRQKQEAPSADEFAQGRGLAMRTISPESVLLTFPLAPDSSFLVAWRSLELRHGDPDCIESQRFLLRPTERWVTAAGMHEEQVPAALVLRELEVAAQQKIFNDYQLTHYLNYR